MKTKWSIALLVFTMLCIMSSAAFATDRSPWAFKLKDESSCDFSIVHSAGQKKTRYNGTFEYCDAVLEISHRALSKTISVIDAPTERGGSAYIISVSNGSMHTTLVEYQGTDEDSLQMGFSAGTVILQTSLEEIRIAVGKDGSLGSPKREKKKA